MVELLRNIGIFLVTIVFDLYIFILLLRYLLQISGVNYFNPIAQFTIRLTDPLVKPLKKILPSFHYFDLPILILLFIFEVIKIYLVLLILWSFSLWYLVPIWAILLLIKKVLNFYFFAVLIRAILSFVTMNMHNPFFYVLFLLTEPLLSRVRMRLPHKSSFDFSPLIVTILIVILLMVVNFLIQLTLAPSVI